MATLTIDGSKAPTQLVLPDAPTYKQYNPNLSMSDFVGQAHQTLAPQLESNIQDLNTQNAQNIQTANNDTLRRGLARGSYAGARVDNINNNNTRNIQRERLNNDIQANTLAQSNYDKAYDRGYQLNKDQNDWNWNTYNSGVDNAKFQYSNSYQAYRDNTADSQWQKSFDQSKLEADRSYNLALKSASSSSGSSSSAKAATTASVNAIMADTMNTVYSVGDGDGRSASQNALITLRNNKSDILGNLMNAGANGDDALKFYTQMETDLNGRITAENESKKTNIFTGINLK